MTIAQHAPSRPSTTQGADYVAITDPAASALSPPGTPATPTALLSSGRISKWHGEGPWTRLMIGELKVDEHLLGRKGGARTASGVQVNIFPDHCRNKGFVLIFRVMFCHLGFSGKTRPPRTQQNKTKTPTIPLESSARAYRNTLQKSGFYLLKTVWTLVFLALNMT